jgi:hypothetical protein
VFECAYITLVLTPCLASILHSCAVLSPHLTSAATLLLDQRYRLVCAWIALLIKLLIARRSSHSRQTEHLHDRLLKQAARTKDKIITEPGSPFCRICLEDNFPNDLVHPCLCVGSIAYVHDSCLSQWRAASQNAHSYFMCDQCRFPYKMKRTWSSYLLRSSLALHLGTACIILSVMLLVSLMLALAEFLVPKLDIHRYVLGLEHVYTLRKRAPIDVAFVHLSAWRYLKPGHLLGGFFVVATSGLWKTDWAMAPWLWGIVNHGYVDAVHRPNAKMVDIVLERVMTMSWLGLIRLLSLTFAWLRGVGFLAKSSTQLTTHRHHGSGSRAQKRTSRLCPYPNGCLPTALCSPCRVCVGWSCEFMIIAKRTMCLYAVRSL